MTVWVILTEHHSKFLVENKRYDKCFALASDDYKGWTEGLAKAGYASGSNYAKSLQKSSRSTDYRSTTGW